MVLIGSGGFLWWLIGSDVILNAVKNLSDCNQGCAIREILRFTQDDRCSGGGFLWGLIGSDVILNAVKNLTGCNKGCAIPEILRFAQDDRGGACEFL